MKNNTIYMSILCLLLCFQNYNGKAQFLDNDINVYFGYVNGNFHNKEIIIEGDFISPSLYSNLEKLNGVSLKALYKGYKYFSFGISLEKLNGYNWEYADRSDYSGAEIILKSISPTIQFHNKFMKDGGLNSLKFVIEISPTFGSSILLLENPLCDIQSENNTVSQPMESTDLFFGLKGNAGFEYFISNSFGAYVTYSFENDWIKSKLYNDKKFSRTQLSFGIFVRFKKDKRYFY